MRRFLIAIALLLNAVAEAVAGGNSNVWTIRGTDLANLESAYEVISRISTIIDNGGTFSIAGQGEAIIYVDGRRLKNHDELSTITGRSVDTIEILSEAALEYGNSSCIILIKTINPEEDKVLVTETAGITLSPHAGGYSNLGVSGKKGKLILDGGLELSYLSKERFEWKCEDKYDGGVQRTVKEYNPLSKGFNMDARLRVGYEITPGHKLYATYKYLLSHSDSEKDNFSKTQGQSSFPCESYSNSDNGTHSLNVNYEGKVKDWTFRANYDMYVGSLREKGDDFDNKGGKRVCTADSRDDHGYMEGYLRTDASHPLWKGDIDMGFHLQDYAQTNYSLNKINPEGITHGKAACLVPGLFATLKQDFGVVQLDAGLLWQYAFYRYEPFEDDPSRAKLIDKIGSPELFWRRSVLMPHLILSAGLDELKLSAGMQTGNVFPNYRYVYLDPDAIKGRDVSAAIIQVETQYTGFVKGDWKWLSVKGWATRYVFPVFRDSGFGHDFNGPDYWSMDWRLSVSPTISVWQTSLTAILHKQWLDMEVVDPVDNLQTPMATFNWTNNVSLPWGMSLDVGALLRTKGAEKNLYYRKLTWKMDLRVRQNFFRDKLTVSLGVENLFNSYCDDIAFYTKASESTLVNCSLLNCRTFKLGLTLNL
ncbi:MAG: outer membrane beta-barrel family protein [Bacteroidales bacterium]|nr:outer membrane beta-barrel family protein [Bacteroidales bacterium]